jgi:hypothetical protein
MSPDPGSVRAKLVLERFNGHSIALSACLDQPIPNPDHADSPGKHVTQQILPAKDLQFQLIPATQIVF